MSLDWNLTKIADHETLCWNTHADGKRFLHPTTHAMILLTPVLGIAPRDEKQAKEFWTRLAIYQSLFGSMVRDERGEYVWITEDDVKAHTGLHTNVFPTTPRGKWVNHITTCFENEIRHTRPIGQVAAAKAACVPALVNALAAATGVMTADRDEKVEQGYIATAAHTTGIIERADAALAQAQEASQ